MKIPNIRKWRFAMILSFYFLGVTILCLALKEWGLGAAHLTTAVTWLVVDIVSESAKGYREAFYREIDRGIDFARESTKEKRRLQRECEELKEQIERLKSIYHIKDTDENYNYETE